MSNRVAGRQPSIRARPSPKQVVGYAPGRRDVVRYLTGDGQVFELTVADITGEPDAEKIEVLEA
jgi:hypothetical protein